MCSASYSTSGCRKGNRGISISQLSVRISILIINSSTTSIIIYLTITKVNSVRSRNHYGKEVAGQISRPIRPNSIKASNLIVTCICFTCWPRWVSYPRSWRWRNNSTTTARKKITTKIYFTG